MRKIIRIFLLNALFAVGMGGVAYAAISGTDHDFSAMGWGTDETCVFCHTPHSDGAADPLWNRAVNAGGDYTTYSSATIDMTIGNPASVSLACLSCHDGTIAIDSYGGRVGANNLSGSALLGQDLSDEHPISVTYDPTVDTAFVAKATVTATLPLYGPGADQVECGTCHDPHNAAGQLNFLRINNAASALCLTCHSK